jgi:hypothetical protein
MGLLSKLLGQKNPADKGLPYLNQVGPMAQQNLNPYISQGQQAGNTANNEYNKLVSNPTAFLDDLFSNYSMTEGFKNRKKEALGTAQHAAAAGGYAGGLGDQKYQMELADALDSEDMQRWYQNVLPLYGMGLQGLQGQEAQGFNATTDLTGILGNTLGSQATLAFQGQQQKNKGYMDFYNMLSGILGNKSGNQSGSSQVASQAASGIW